MWFQTSSPISCPELHQHKGLWIRAWRLNYTVKQRIVGLFQLHQMWTSCFISTHQTLGCYHLGLNQSSEVFDIEPSLFHHKGDTISLPCLKRWKDIISSDYYSTSNPLSDKFYAMPARINHIKHITISLLISEWITIHNHYALFRWDIYCHWL